MRKIIIAQLPDQVLELFGPTLAYVPCHYAFPIVTVSSSEGGGRSSGVGGKGLGRRDTFAATPSPRLSCRGPSASSLLRTWPS